ncbi:MAG: hypothetical protein PF541_00215 [Prolixibacteraceae bacterium]|nr:hypothetical protein [Prolixibacteraceae bacterium]
MKAQVFEYGAGFKLIEFMEQSYSPNYYGTTVDADLVFGFSIPLVAMCNNTDLGMYSGFMLGQAGMASIHNSGLAADPLWDFSVPLYLTVGIGPGTRKANDRKFGFKLGIGYVWNNYIVNSSSELIHSSISPQFMVECIFNNPKRNFLNGFKIRYERQMLDWMESGYITLSENYANVGLWQHSITASFVFKKNIMQYNFE